MTLLCAKLRANAIIAKLPQLTNSDFTKGSIITDSFIRPDKIATLDKVMIRRTLGTITDSKLSEVKLSLRNFLEIS